MEKGWQIKVGPQRCWWHHYTYSGPCDTIPTGKSIKSIYSSSPSLVSLNYVLSCRISSKWTAWALFSLLLPSWLFFLGGGTSAQWVYDVIFQKYLIHIQFFKHMGLCVKRGAIRRVLYRLHSRLLATHGGQIIEASPQAVLNGSYKHLTSPLKDLFNPPSLETNLCPPMAPTIDSRQVRFLSSLGYVFQK